MQSSLSKAIKLNTNIISRNNKINSGNNTPSNNEVVNNSVTNTSNESKKKPTSAPSTPNSHRKDTNRPSIKESTTSSDKNSIKNEYTPNNTIKSRNSTPNSYRVRSNPLSINSGKSSSTKSNKSIVINPFNPSPQINTPIHSNKVEYVNDNKNDMEVIDTPQRSDNQQTLDRESNLIKSIEKMLNINEDSSHYNISEYSSEEFSLSYSKDVIETKEIDISNDNRTNIQINLMQKYPFTGHTDLYATNCEDKQNNCDHKNDFVTKTTAESSKSNPYCTDTNNVTYSSPTIKILKSLQKNDNNSNINNDSPKQSLIIGKDESIIDVNKQDSENKNDINIDRIEDYFCYRTYYLYIYIASANVI